MKGLEQSAIVKYYVAPFSQLPQAYQFQPARQDNALKIIIDMQQQLTITPIFGIVAPPRGKKRFADKLMEIIIGLLLGLIAFYFINAYIGGRRYSRPPRIRISFANPQERGLEYEDVTLTSADGVQLAGWYIPSKNKAALILLHGYSGNRLAVMHHAELFAAQGYGILMTDLRAHGASGGSGTFARSETMISDVLAALSFLQARPEVDTNRIGVFGTSVGGTMAIQAGARLKGIRAVVADGVGPASYEDLLPVRSLPGRLLLPVHKLFFQTAERSIKAKALPPNKQAIGQIAPRPVLLVSTGRGAEATLTERLHTAAHEPKQLWEIPTAKHASGWMGMPDEYGQTVNAFWHKHLLAS